MKQNLLFNRANAFGMRLSMVLTMLLTIGIGTMWGEDYELVSFSNIKTNDVIIIVGTKSDTAYAMKNTGTPPTPIKVTISNSKITSTATDITFTATNNGDNTITFVSTNSGTLYCTNANNGVKIGSQTGNDTKFSFDSCVNRLKNIGQTRWLGIYNTQDWRCYTSASATNISGTTTTFYRKVTAAPSHTITATSNNNSYGTVSVSGTTITATPNDGYRVKSGDAGYTVTSGTADVTNNGDNTFSVTPSSNCTITINFEAIPTHQIIFNTGGLNVIAPISVAEGSTYNITQEPTGLTNECEYNTFVGWTTENSISNPSTKPEIVTSVEMGNTEINLYAVYSKTEGGGGSGNYEKVTTESELEDGQYLIVYESGSVAFNGALTTLDAVSNTISVTITNNTIVPTSTIDAAVFTYDKTNNTLKSASGYYIGKTEYSNGLNVATTAYTNTITFDNSGNCVITASGGCTLRYNNASDQNRFRYYKSGQQEIQLYKKGNAGTTTYSLTPQCSTETLVSVLPKIMNFWQSIFGVSLG